MSHLLIPQPVLALVRLRWHLKLYIRTSEMATTAKYSKGHRLK